MPISVYVADERFVTDGMPALSAGTIACRGLIAVLASAIPLGWPYIAAKLKLIRKGECT